MSRLVRIALSAGSGMIYRGKYELRVTFLLYLVSSVVERREGA